MAASLSVPRLNIHTFRHIHSWELLSTVPVFHFWPLEHLAVKCVSTRHVIGRSGGSYLFTYSRPGAHYTLLSHTVVTLIKHIPEFTVDAAHVKSHMTINRFIGDIY